MVGYLSQEWYHIVIIFYFIRGWPSGPSFVVGPRLRPPVSSFGVGTRLRPSGPSFGFVLPKLGNLAAKISQFSKLFTKIREHSRNRDSIFAIFVERKEARTQTTSSSLDNADVTIYQNDSG